MIIIDEFNRILEIAMPLQRKVARQRIAALDFQLSDHIVKLLCYPSSNLSRIHYAAEIAAWLNSIDRFSDYKGGKRLSVKNIKNLLYDGPWDPFNEAIVTRRRRQAKDGSMLDLSLLTKSIMGKIYDELVNLLDGPLITPDMVLKVCHSLAD